MTSGETLTFYAGVTLGARWTSSSKRERVAEVLQAVGLGHSTDTLVSANHRQASTAWQAAIHSLMLQV